jgi:hypothetical protein
MFLSMSFLFPLTIFVRPASGEDKIIDNQWFAISSIGLSLMTVFR